MAAFARRERAALTDLFDSVGPDAPTLCGGWSTYDLAAHLVLREANPLAALGIAVPALEKVTDKGMQRLQARRTFTELVRALRVGPPRFSPLRPARIDAAANAMEFFIHHEDVRRAGAPEHPRELDERDQRLLWAATRRMGRMLGRNAPVGIELVRTEATDTSRISTSRISASGISTVRISSGEPTVVVRGLPSELALYAYGRGAVADVAVSGDETALTEISNDHLGL